VSGAILPSVFQALRAADLADQIELLKLTPEAMSPEEMSRLWSALQGHYRPTSAFVVSVVLIERPRPTRTPLPVLTRGRFDAALQRDEGVIVAVGLTPPFPTLTAVTAAAHETPATLRGGDTVTLTGHHLAGTQRELMLRNDRLGIAQALPLPDTALEGDFDFVLPDLPNDLPVGVYRLELSVLRAGDTAPRVSNALPVALAPAITSFPPVSIGRDPLPDAVLHISITCTPAARPGQRVALMMDGAEAPALPFSAATTTLAFDFERAPPAGATPLLRLKIDGIESVVVNRAVKPPVFFNHRIVLP